MYIIDYLVVIALDEEFRVALSALSKGLGIKLPTHPEGPLVTGRAVIPFTKNETAYEELLLVVCPGQMGHTAIAATLPDVLNRYRPRDTILIGLSGSFEPTTLLLGDVLVPMKIFGYAEQKVAGSVANDVWTFRKLGDRTNSHLLAEVRNIANDPARYRKWRDEARKRAKRDEQIASRLGTEVAHEAPEIHAHHNDSLASGNVVVASTAYAQQLKDNVDATLRAVDMEAGGLFEALEKVDWPGRVMVLRGISDYADSEKSKLEIGFKNSWRTYAMQNAVRLATALMRQRHELEEAPHRVSDSYSLSLEPHRDSYNLCSDVGLTNRMEGAQNLAFSPLFSRLNGAPSFQMSIDVTEVPNADSVRMLLCEHVDPYTEIRHSIRPGGKIEVSKNATHRSFCFDLFLSVPADSFSLMVALKDEFGRTARERFP